MGNPVPGAVDCTEFGLVLYDLGSAAAGRLFERLAEGDGPYSIVSIAQGIAVGADRLEQIGHHGGRLLLLCRQRAGLEVVDLTTAEIHAAGVRRKDRAALAIPDLMEPLGDERVLALIGADESGEPPPPPQFPLQARLNGNYRKQGH